MIEIEEEVALEMVALDTTAIEIIGQIDPGQIAVAAISIVSLIQH